MFAYILEERSYLFGSFMLHQIYIFANLGILLAYGIGWQMESINCDSWKLFSSLIFFSPLLSEELVYQAGK